GFNATLENWSSFGIYQRLDLLPRLAAHYTCIAFDRRESGRSGGRVERITWADYAAQGRGLLDELGIECARLLGGCIGCSCVAAFPVAYPQRVERMVLYSPAGRPGSSTATPSPAPYPRSSSRSSSRRSSYPGTTPRTRPRRRATSRSASRAPSTGTSRPKSRLPRTRRLACSTSYCSDSPRSSAA